MPNRYFNNTIDLINNTRARASDVEANFDQIEDGFDTAQAEMDLKANAASPSLTGTPTAPTAAPGTNTTQIATTAFVHAERANATTLTNKTINLASNTLQATSAQLAAAVSDETGSGPLVFGNSPTITSPTITGGTISGAVVSGSANINVQRFTGNGVTTVFTLSSNPVSENNTQIYIDGVYQQKDTYSISGTTLTFSEAPDVGLTNPENIEVITTSMQAIGTTTSDLVSYTPSGTGAVATNVQAKLRESVSVLDFGADPTGVADSTTAIQNAINSGAKRVIAPAGGTYRITNALTVDADGVEFNFNHSTLRLDDATGLLNHILLGNGTTQRNAIRVRNVTFTRAQVATAGYAIDSNRIGVTEISGCRIFGDNKIHGGIRIYRGIIVNIFDNYIDSCVNLGLRLDGSGTGADRTVDVSIRENRIEGGVTALSTWDFVEGVFCRDNIFFNTSSSAAAVNASSNANGLVSFKFQENDFDTCGGAGLFIDKVSNIQVTGCWFSSITSDALQLKADCVAAVVSGNQFYPTAVGIRVECPDVRIGDNLISGGTTCINIAGGTRVGINGNTLQNANVGVNIGSAVNVQIVGNLLSGIATDAYQNISSTTSIQSNRGDGYAGANSFITVGASPFTYTAGPTTEYVSIFSGTVSNIQIGSNSIGFGTNRTVVLAPNQAVTVTYSSVPFMVKNLL
jgi:hypothetical protein